MIILRDNSYSIDNRLDRIEQFDSKSRSFSVTEVFPERELISRVWLIRTVLDQGREGACVGFGTTHALLAEPKAGDKDVFTADFARNKIYRPAQLNDEFPGQEPEMSGTSVLAGLKEAKKLGHITGYHWAFGLQEALVGLSWYGPAVIGVRWYAGMTDPDEFGFIHPTGRCVGGHCCLVSSINIQRETVCIHNSWGYNWGIEGRAWLNWEDFDKLLERGGECAFLDKSCD
jgi:hypothetical protein